MPKNDFKHYCWLAVMVIIIYWPVSTFLFAMKNDALAGYFPAKYFIAESIHNKIIPWWNPFINYGYPMHADFTSSFWSPFTWIFSLFGGYNVYTVHLEYLLYCILAAWGMFRLSLSLKQNVHAAFIIALCYSCGGIFTGNAQHTNWLSAAALLPFVFNAYLNTINEPRFKNTVQLSLWVTLFMVCAHPYLIICLFYITTILFFILSKKTPASTWKTMMYFGLSVLLVLLLTGGYLFSTMELFPYLTRSDPPNSEQIGNHFPIASIFSMLVPFSTVSHAKVFQNTDLSMRNAYMGIVILIFLIATLTSKKTYYQKIFIGTATFFFILSFGGPITNFFNHYVPLIGFVRLISIFRLPAIFFLLIACGYTLSNFLKGEKPININKIAIALIMVTGLLLGYAIINLIQNHEAILPITFTRQGIKEWIENITLEKTILLQSLIQIPLLYILLRKKTQRSFKLLSIVCFVDLFMAVGLNAPFTIVGQKSVKEVQKLLNTAPKGFPFPELKPIIQNPSTNIDFEKTFGSWSMYSKNFGTIMKAKTYPSLFKTNEKYFDAGLNNVFIHSPFTYIAQIVNTYKDSIRFTNEDAYVCFIKQDDKQDSLHISSKSSATSIQLIEALPNHFSFRIHSNESAILVLKQNYYKYWAAYEDGKRINITPCNYTFMSVPLTTGNHIVEFIYSPRLPKLLGIINLFTLILSVCYLLNPFDKRK
ncbi:MAG TPA: YfhO family protein [Chitinophagaceae bacterium]|nr:YfhO family protein [Chitinophagaceae bacterium]